MAANLQSMFQYWKNFDFPSLQRDLDTQANELVAKSEESDTNRKKLVEQSRDFKKSTPEDIRKVCAPLLKLFQGEIDSLSKRSKNAEAAFLSVYKKLIDAPDPVPVLEHAQQLSKKAARVSDLEIENKQLRETLDEYNTEFAEVKNQEVTIKNLREKCKEYEEKMEQSAQLRAKEKEKELQRLFADKERQLQETQLSVAKKLGEAEHKVSTLQSALDSTQSELFDLKAKYDEATSAKSDEMEIIVADLERANERAAAAEREAEKWRQQLDSATQNLAQAEQMTKAPDMEQAIDILKRSSLEVELAAKEKEIAQLVDDVQRLQSTINKMRDSSSSTVAKLEEELSAKNRAFRILEDKLRTQEDYEEIKRELCVLKSLEFAHASEGGSESGKSEESKPKTLETLLLEKNRALQTENTQLNVANAELRTPPPSSVERHPLANTDAFASMIGQELVATYHLHNQLHLAHLERERERLEREVAAGRLPPAALAGLPLGPGTPRLPPLGTTPGGTPPPSSTTTTTTTTHTDTALLNGRRSPASPDSSPDPQQHLARIQSIARSESINSMTLDTAMVSQRIRDILSTNNIGQRLFAKHVLGLSQGTVSELLSKPKHWDKLTEKGRESYRKMYAWACDEQNVQTLKAIAPKKGNAPMMSTFRQEDAHTEERIAQILNEASKAMQEKQVVEKSQAANAMVANIYQQELAKIAGSGQLLDKRERLPQLENASSMENRGRKLLHPDPSEMSHEIVARIYQEELAKLAAAAEQSGNIAESNMYRQELSRLAHNARRSIKREEQQEQESNHLRDKENNNLMNRSSGDSNKENQEEAPLDLKVKTEPGTMDAEPRYTRDQRTPSRDTPSSQAIPQDLSPSAAATPDGLRHSGSAFFLVRPRPNNPQQPELGAPPFLVGSPGPGGPGGAGGPLGPGAPPGAPGDMSPLQRMQSIANSLMTKNQAPVHQQRPLKAVLPPITQEQFDSYSNVNTDDLVKKVKEALSQFSISQRLFGENVLGLSQGSVSDLLARPKPWHMLTQKGREPFIRMQLFLEDPESIPRLVANQYRIPPDKFLRSQNFEGMPVPPRKPKQSPKIIHQLDDFPPVFPGSPPKEHVLITHHRHLSPGSSSRATSRAPSAPSPSLAPLASSSSTASSTPRSPTPTPALYTPPVALPHHHHPLDFPVVPPLQHSVFEIAAMTQELDTLAITSKVKEVLQFNNLGQKLFGEAVLALSQGSVSELLSKPKPWHMLSLKGREPFIKMQMWLTDPLNVERLRIYQNEMKVRKRKGSTDERSSLDGQIPQKKPRVFFSEEQKEQLRMAYAQDPYPNQSRIEGLASELGVGTKTVVNWFHNHRMRAKQQYVGSPGTPLSNGSCSSQQYAGVKNEPEDLSNHSDCHSLSGSSDAGSQARGGGEHAASMGQWMFPSFEPVAPHGGGRRGEALPPSSSMQAAEKEERPDTGRANKRKRAKPCRIYDTSQDKAAMTPEPEQEEKENTEDAPVNLSTSSPPLVTRGDEDADKEEDDEEEGDSQQRKAAIEKLSQSISQSAPGWDEMDRQDNIDKLEKSLTEEQEEEDWEF